MAVKILIKRKFKDENLKAAARLLISHRNGAMTQLAIYLRKPCSDWKIHLGSQWCRCGKI